RGLGARKLPFSEDMRPGTRLIPVTEAKLSIQQQEVVSGWDELMLSMKVIEPCQDIPTMRTVVAANDRVTHNAQGLYIAIQKDGKFPGGQNTHAIMAWAYVQKYLAKVDLSKAFHSIPVREDQKKYYCFEFKGQKYRYRMMPMGAATAPKHFHQVMGQVLGRFEYGTSVRHYQDDIIVGASTRAEMTKIYEALILHMKKEGF